MAGRDLTSDASLLRSATIGAALLAAATAPGTCFYLYNWVTTENILHLDEAMALLFAASLAGGAGGFAYQMVNRSKVQTRWKQFIAFLAALEAYLLTFSLITVAIDWVAPQLNSGLPLGELRFWIVLHFYGVLLCIGVWGFLFAPRLVQMIVGIVALITLSLASVTILSVLFIRPDQLDQWFTFVKPFSVVLPLILVAFVVVSVVGWIRYLHLSRQTE